MTRNPGQLPRGVDDSHSHHSDSLIDPNTNEVYVPPAGEQTIRLLGPYRIAFDDADLAGDGLILTGFPETCVLLDLSFYVDDEWTSGESAALEVYVVDGEWAADGTASSWNLLTTPTSAGEATKSLEDSGTRSSWLLRGAGTTVRAIFDGTPTAGTGDLYALIAEPAE